MLTVEDLKAEYRLQRTGDNWGDCLGALFPVATELAVRDLEVPAEWGYSPGAYGPHHDAGDSWTEVVQEADNDALLVFGNALHRLANILKARGLDY